MCADAGARGAAGGSTGQARARGGDAAAGAHRRRAEGSGTRGGRARRGGPAPPHAHAGNELPRGRPSGAARGQACEEDARRELLEARLAPLRLAAKQEARAALQSAEAGFRRARAPACSAGLLAHRGG